MSKLKLKLKWMSIQQTEETGQKILEKPRNSGGREKAAEREKSRRTGQTKIRDDLEDTDSEEEEDE